LRPKIVIIGASIIAVLVFIAFLINTIDIYVAVATAAAADLYIFGLSKKSKKTQKPSSHKSAAPLMMVAIVPICTAVVLFFLGYTTTVLEAAARAMLTTGFSISFFVTSYPIMLALKYKKKEDKLIADPNYPKPLVSILVPAYNEQAVISRTITSLLNIKYENKEIIIIDDGSTDLTKIVASGYEKNGVKVLSKPNGGKAAALNYGLQFAKGEIVITIDADSMIARDAVDEIVKVMASDPDIAAVAGNIKVLNSNSLLTRIQELEYIMAISTIRRAFALFGSVMVIPGAFGAFKKKMVKEVGGYDVDTMTEDFDITIKLLKTRGAVSSSSTGKAYTEVPVTWKALYKQRIRWGTGTFQTIFKHKDIFANPRYGILHDLVFPILLFSIYNPLASFLSLAAAAALILTAEGLVLAEMLSIFLLVQLLVSLLALSIDNEGNGLALYSPFFVVIYKQFLDVITLISLVKAFSRKEKKWQKLQRSGGLEAIKVRK
jgi:biofilm PGA synthesis N-glycosyltransferase PgaC